MDENKFGRCSVNKLRSSVDWLSCYSCRLGIRNIQAKLEFEKRHELEMDFSGSFSFLIIITMIVVQEIWLPYKDGYSVFGMKSFELPLGTGNIHVWPQLLWDFLNVHSTDTTVLALLFGILFLTKSAPQISRSYKLILIGGVIFISVFNAWTFLVFIL